MAGVTRVTRQISATLGLSPWQNWPLAGNARQAASPDGHLGNRYECEAINLSTLEILGSRDPFWLSRGTDCNRRAARRSGRVRSAAANVVRRRRSGLCRVGAAELLLTH
jgi:hypothetical protein